MKRYQLKVSHESSADIFPVPSSEHRFLRRAKWALWGAECNRILNYDDSEKWRFLVWDNRTGCEVSFDINEKKCR